QALDEVSQTGKIQPEGHSEYLFNPNTAIRFDFEKSLDGHPNGMIFYAYDSIGTVLFEETYYSVGGGFVQTASELASGISYSKLENTTPYPFKNASEMLEMCVSTGKSIAELKSENEQANITKSDLSQGINKIWDVMNNCIEEGLKKEGILPGGLFVKRRAKGIHESLRKEQSRNIAPPHIINDWMSCYAMAVNEQNAAGAQIVTAPTNGAAGVIPATLRYYLDHVPSASISKIPEFLLTAAAIGGLIKNNASISGAEVGCQGEVGSAAAMAAAGLCAILGGSPQQVENAAEIALEHHLGMTCDPIKGLVQAPCIERNGLGAIKAVSAASLALRGDGIHLVSLDACIETMRQTGIDMNSKYKETSLGGLAVNLPEC
ncbi:L-serine ammonia-lyase, partial [Amylibacter sp.]|nr:L-serine ammonia-lyase [Amylibacter sp.]